KPETETRLDTAKLVFAKSEDDPGVPLIDVIRVGQDNRVEALSVVSGSDPAAIQPGALIGAVLQTGDPPGPDGKRRIVARVLRCVADGGEGGSRAGRGLRVACWGAPHVDASPLPAEDDFSDVETDVLFEGNVTRRNLRADSAYGWGIQLQPLFARGLVLNVTLRHNRSYANRMGLFVP